MDYSVIKPASIRPLVAAGGGQAFQQQAGERRRRASSLQLASPPVATRNGLDRLLLGSAILTRKFCHTALIPLACAILIWIKADKIRKQRQKARNELLSESRGRRRSRMPVIE